MKNVKLLSALIVLIGFQQTILAEDSYAKNRADAQALIEEAYSIDDQWKKADVSSNPEARYFKEEGNFCNAVIQYCSWYKKNPSDRHHEKYCDHYADNMRKQWKRLSSLLDGTAKPPVDEATRMKKCEEIPISTRVKAKLLDKTCHDLVDKYGDLVQGNLQRVKESTRLTPEIKETPFYRSTRAEMCDMRFYGESHYQYYARLEARAKLMETEQMNESFKKLQESDFNCEPAAREIDRVF